MPTEIDSIIIKLYIKADTNKNLSLSLDEIQRLFFNLKLNDEDYIEDIMRHVRMKKGLEKLNYRDFEMIARILVCRREFIPIFETYTETKITDHQMLFEKIMK